LRSLAVTVTVHIREDMRTDRRPGSENTYARLQPNQHFELALRARILTPEVIERGYPWSWRWEVIY
jgi:hypothetical protein